MRSKFRIRRIWEQSRLRYISKFSSKKKAVLVLWLICLMLSSVIFGLSRPQIPYKKPIKKPLDIVCLVDLSRSMNTRDVLRLGKEIFRLDLAKEELSNFVKNQVGENKNRMALIAFAFKANYRYFFTWDVGSLLFHIDYLSVKDFPPEGTDIGAAIWHGLGMLDLIDNKPEIFNQPKNKRVFVLISDGEDLGESLDQAIEEISRRKIPVYTIGVGSREGGYVIEEIDEQGNIIYMIDEDEGGQKVSSKLEEETLKKIAQKTNGKYVYSKTGEELAKAFADVLEREAEREIEPETAYHDTYHYLFRVAFLLALGLLIIIFKKN